MVDDVDRRHSTSPKAADRERQDDKGRRKDKGFKWKDKRRDDDDRRDRDSGYQRGYREQYRPRSRSPSRSPRRDRSPRRPRSPRRDRDKYDSRDDDVRRKYGDETKGDKTERKEKKEKKEKKPVVATPQQPMIRVTVNDRLGTKHTIPCFPSDPIGDFKKIVSAYIGRPAHEILLKRQGERPFKDQLTLQDYGISNDVQIDLEVDTGD